VVQEGRALSSSRVSIQRNHPEQDHRYSELISRTDLIEHGYTIRVLTRDPNSEYARDIVSYPQVSVTIGSQDDETAIRQLFTGADLAFVNTNSWVLGIKGDTYLGIRAFELAMQCGIKHYIYSSLDNVGLQNNFDDDTRAQHYGGKAHVEQWMYSVPQSPMRWSILTTGPYIEQLFGFMAPRKAEDGVYEFRMPVKDGAIPYVHVDDLSYYVRWIFEHPEEAAGLNVGATIEHVSLDKLVDAFVQVVGKPARAVSPEIDDWFAEIGWDKFADLKVGVRTLREGDPSMVSVKDSFSNWWRLYQRSGGNKGLIRRDYAMLDRIHPQRISSVKAWMEKVKYDPDEKRQATFTNPLGI
jgi:uncharacterized protein YbjT (DUF2867 family)